MSNDLQARLRWDSDVTSGEGKPGYSFRMVDLRIQVLWWLQDTPVQFSCSTCHRRLDAFGFKKISCRSGHPVPFSHPRSLITPAEYADVLAERLEDLRDLDPLAAMVVSQEVAGYIEDRLLNRSKRNPLGKRKGDLTLRFARP